MLFFKKSLTIFIGYLTDFQRNSFEFHLESMFLGYVYRGYFSLILNTVRKYPAIKLPVLISVLFVCGVRLI